LKRLGSWGKEGNRRGNVGETLWKDSDRWWYRRDLGIGSGFGRDLRPLRLGLGRGEAERGMGFRVFREEEVWRELAFGFLVFGFWFLVGEEERSEEERGSRKEKDDIIVLYQVTV
jgi:hypothetical protein